MSPFDVFEDDDFVPPIGSLPDQRTGGGSRAADDSEVLTGTPGRLAWWIKVGISCAATAVATWYAT